MSSKFQNIYVGTTVFLHAFVGTYSMFVLFMIYEYTKQQNLISR